MLDLCPTCPGRTNWETRKVLPVGPTPCPLLFIGAGPGKREAITLIPYSGQAGDELTDTYLPAAYLSRDEVHLANSSCCWDGTDRTPNEGRVVGCARLHLPDLLDRVKPEVVVLMGGVTQRLADKRIRLDMHHGIPQRGSLLGGVWEGWIWPSYEPALGMRETSRMSQLLEDFRNLGRWWRGEWEPVRPAEEVEKDYAVVSSVDSLVRYIRGDGTNGATPCRLTPDGRPKPSIDTERHGRKLWSLQFSLSPGTGRLLRCPDTRPLLGTGAGRETGLLREFNQWVRETQAEATLHHAGQDLDAMEGMGVVPVSVRNPTEGFRDTMQEAYQLCSLPQGLKALSYRLLGVTMRTWEDVVWPASVEAWAEWAGEAVYLAGDSQQVEVRTDLKRGRCADCGHQHSKGPCKRPGCGCVSTAWTMVKIEHAPGAVEKILRHVLRYTLATVEADKPYHPWKKMVGMQAEGLRGDKATAGEWDWVEEFVGPMPILGIGNVKDEAEEIAYSVGDADMTGQVASELEVRRGDRRWVVEKEDYDT